MSIYNQWWLLEIWFLCINFICDSLIFSNTDIDIFVCLSILTKRESNIKLRYCWVERGVYKWGSYIDFIMHLYCVCVWMCVFQYYLCYILKIYTLDIISIFMMCRNQDAICWSVSFCYEIGKGEIVRNWSDSFMFSRWQIVSKTMKKHSKCIEDIGRSICRYQKTMKKCSKCIEINGRKVSIDDRYA